VTRFWYTLKNLHPLGNRWEHLGEPIGNLIMEKMEAFKEIDVNILRTWGMLGF
jgi:hypothetical protein